MNSCWISQNHEGIAGGFFAVFAETGVSHAPFQCHWHCHLGGAQSINGETRDRETRVVFFPYLSFVSLALFMEGVILFLHICIWGLRWLLLGENVLTRWLMFLICLFFLCYEGTRKMSRWTCSMKERGECQRNAQPYRWRPFRILGCGSTAQGPRAQRRGTRTQRTWWHRSSFEWADHPTRHHPWSDFAGWREGGWRPRRGYRRR